jgi:hypothetical protein
LFLIDLGNAGLIDGNGMEGTRLHALFAAGAAVPAALFFIYPAAAVTAH